jgi:hypothetical protein
MNKIKQKLINKISKFSDDFSKDTAEVCVNIALERDLYTKTKQYKDVVRDLYPQYLENYVKVCNYLHNDFNIHFANFNGDKTDISKELQLKDQVEKILNEKPEKKMVNKLRIFIRKTKDIFEYTKQYKRWWILSTILKNYGDALDLLKSNTDELVYKDINIYNEIENLKHDKYLIDEFTDKSI